MADYAISNVPRRAVYAASGTGPYAFTFEILSQTDIAVYKASTLLTLTTDYTVTINSNGTGSVTLVTSAGTSNITIVGAKTIQRTSDYTTGGDLFASTLNTDLDSLTIFSQQVAETAERGLKAPVTDPTDIAMTLPDKAGRKGKVLAFDSTTGNPVAGPALDSVTTVIEQSANINTVANNISSVNTVAGNNSNVTTVAGVSSSVTTVAGIASNVTSVAGNATNINTVAGNNSNISTVAGVSSSVSTVAGISANVTTVAGISSAVSTVATNNANVSAVGSNISAVNTNASNITAIQNASTNATNAANSATAAGNAQTAAEAARDATLTAYDNFDDRYLGSKTSDPTLDNDGNALAAGSLYFNSVSGAMKVYTGSAWVAAYVSGTDYLAKASNLSDLTSASSARTNLGLGTAATVADSTLVHTSGNETIGGTKTFSVDASISGLTVGKGGSAVARNTVLGYTALTANTSGNYNTAVGYTALVGNLTGERNTAVGERAMVLNTSGSENTALGELALYSNNGSYNTALGRSALETNTTASYNTAVGYQAGYTNTTGANNAFFGVYAGYGNTTGSYNTAIGGPDSGGYSPVSTNTTGSSNVGVGAGALAFNTTASKNTAVGYQAGYSAVTSAGNTFVGYQAGYSHAGSAGEYSNTFIGFNAGYAATTGYTNTFVGYNAGSAVTTGLTNVILGSYTGNSGGLDIRTASGYIVLSDGSGNPRANWNSRGVMTTTNDNADACIYATNSAGSSPYGIQMYFSGAAPNNTSQWFHLAQDTSALRFVVMANGGIKNYSANDVNLSDETVKKDITLAGNYLDKICAIPVKTFLYKDQTDTDLNLGVIAQDVQAVAPELTTEADWGTKENPEVKLSVYESDLMFALMKSIQELNAKVEAQALEIAQLKGN